MGIHRARSPDSESYLIVCSPPLSKPTRRFDGLEGDSDVHGLDPQILYARHERNYRGLRWLTSQPGYRHGQTRA